MSGDGMSVSHKPNIPGNVVVNGCKIAGHRDFEDGHSVKWLVGVSIPRTLPDYNAKPGKK
jgi:hypothetical protein